MTGAREPDMPDCHFEFSAGQIRWLAGHPERPICGIFTHLTWHYVGHGQPPLIISAPARRLHCRRRAQTFPMQTEIGPPPEKTKPGFKFCMLIISLPLENKALYEIMQCFLCSYYVTFSLSSLWMTKDVCARRIIFS